MACDVSGAIAMPKWSDITPVIISPLTLTDFLAKVQLLNHDGSYVARSVMDLNT